jgi:hypothetical protein
MTVTSYDRGYAEGIERGLESAVLAQLEERFGTLPEGVRARVESLGRDELLDLTRRVMHAQTLAELGLL